MKRGTLIIVVLVIAVLIINGIFTFNQSKNNADTINIGSFSRAIDYAPYLIAKDKGWFEEVAENYGATVGYTEFQSLAPINEAFATGNIDIVFEAESPAIIGNAAGIDIKIKGVGVSLLQEILVPTDSGINEVSDLKNRKIAILAGTSSHYGVIKILEQNGLSGNDIEVIDMIPPDARAAFETGQVDAWAVWPPWVEQQEVSGNGVTLKGGDAFIQSIVAVRGGFAKTNLELSSDLLYVVKRAQNWIKDNEEEAQTIVSEQLDIELEVTQRAWPKHNFQAIIGEDEIRDIQEKADFLFEEGLIQNEVNVRTDLIDLE